MQGKGLTSGVQPIRDLLGSWPAPDLRMIKAAWDLRVGGETRGLNVWPLGHSPSLSLASRLGEGAGGMEKEQQDVQMITGERRVWSDFLRETI